MAKPRKRGDKWEVRWFDDLGKRRSQSFTSYSAALRIQRRFEVEVEERKLGLRTPTVDPHTFNELAEYQLRYKTPLKRSPKDDVSMIGRHLRPFFGSMPLVRIGVGEIARFVDIKREALSPKTVNNLLTLLGSMLRAAVDLEWLSKLPRIEKVAEPKSEFQYLRDRTQVRALLHAAGHEVAGTLELYAAAVYTGMRCGELLGLQWSDVSFDRRLITVQRSYDKPTKSNRVRYVPILDALLPILRQWRLQNGLPLVFPNQQGNMHTPSPRITQETLQRCLNRAGLHRIRFHDLRHTFAAQWVMSGGDIYRLQRILGHASIAMTECYAHLAPDIYAEDYARLGDTPELSDATIIEIAAQTPS